MEYIVLRPILYPFHHAMGWVHSGAIGRNQFYIDLTLWIFIVGFPLGSLCVPYNDLPDISANGKQFPAKPLCKQAFFFRLVTLELFVDQVFYMCNALNRIVQFFVKRTKRRDESGTRFLDVFFKRSHKEILAIK